MNGKKNAQKGEKIRGEKINKLINKRLKAFQLRQWTKCFCSLSNRILDIFPCFVCEFFQFSLSTRKKSIFSFAIQCERSKIWKIAKMKNSIKTRTDNCCLNDSWKSAKILCELKRCEFRQMETGATRSVATKKG